MSGRLCQCVRRECHEIVGFICKHTVLITVNAWYYCYLICMYRKNVFSFVQYDLKKHFLLSMTVTITYSVDYFGDNQVISNLLKSKSLLK